MDWAKKFEEKLHGQEVAKQEHKKNFDIYQQSATKLYEWIEGKVKKIEKITIIRYMVGQSDTKRVQIRALKLKCYEKFLDFVPEGINLDQSKGTIRIRHNSHSLAQFTYLHLIINPNSKDIYPENLMWVLNESSSEPFTNLPVFDEAKLEYLIERTFLEA